MSYLDHEQIHCEIVFQEVILHLVIRFTKFLIAFKNMASSFSEYYICAEH